MSANHKKTIKIINGPNINMLGHRESIYGTFSLDDLKTELNEMIPQSIQLSFFQSNSEGDLITEIQSCKSSADGLIINPAAFTHTSIGIKDALACLEIPKIEVHITNIYKREAFRQKNMTASESTGMISGFGKSSYTLALVHLIDILCQPPQ